MAKLSTVQTDPAASEAYDSGCLHHLSRSAFKQLTFLTHCSKDLQKEEHQQGRQRILLQGHCLRIIYRSKWRITEHCKLRFISQALAVIVQGDKKLIKECLVLTHHERWINSHRGLFLQFTPVVIGEINSARSQCFRAGRGENYSIWKFLCSFAYT